MVPTPFNAPELRREFERARFIGQAFTVLLPLVGAAVAAFTLDAGRMRLAPLANELAWLGYALLAFSVSICLIARIVLQQLMAHVRRLLMGGAYRRGRLTVAYLALFTLYLCPAMWGFIYLLVGGALPVAAILVAITLSAGLFLVPPPDTFLR
jgi:hypothetical protein